ncbi:MAG: methionine synthase [bacterium]|nr:methionine synthase [bacterium]
MNALFSELLASGPVVTDGAWGTLLYMSGLPMGDSPDAWNLTHADRVEKVARSYTEAGAQIVLTNTFGANRLTLKKHGLADRAAEINRAGVEISRRAAAGRARVFASIGPTGLMLMTGETSEDELDAAFEEQAEALAKGGADALVVETMLDPAEAASAVRAAKRTGLPVVACMTYSAGKKKDRTVMGTTPEQAVEVLTQAGADAIGSNCGQGVEGFIPICQRLHAASPLPIWIKANAGLPEMENGEVVYKTTPEQFAAHVKPLVEAGASFIGGCCGTNPEFIRAVRKTLAA